jgi:ubiquinone/menaquinone biosynthesis C-methylase UbiE
VLLAEDGHEVHGVDLAEAMLAAARAKASAAGVPATFAQGDAAHPPLAPRGFDVVLSRHVLWALPDPSAALARWVALLRPGGRMLLVEGFWDTGAGLTARRCADLVRAHRASAVVHRLTDPRLWGRPVVDERYLLLSTS